MRIAIKVGVGVVVSFAVLQVVRFDQTNPPVTADIQAPPDVENILRRSCYDCHSNETRWPWYSQVAPASWLVHYDVSEGRDALNLSTWEKLSPRERSKELEEIGESIADGDMPPWYYLPLHPAARLSGAERSALQAWVGPSRKDR